MARRYYEKDLVRVKDKDGNIIIEGQRLECFRKLSKELTGKTGQESGYKDLKALCKAFGYSLEVLKEA